MAQDDSGEKTEKPTDKRLRDARKKGEIAKSKELTSTITLVAWVAIAGLALPFVCHRISELTLRAFEAVTLDFEHAAPRLGTLGIEILLWVSAITMLPAIALALLTEFLQAGPVFTFEKITPKLENMNPITRIGQWFSADQWMEVLLSVVKAALMCTIAWMVLRSALPQIAALPTGGAPEVVKALDTVGMRLLGWTVAAFAMVSVGDLAWQHHRFIKKQRMSLRDIRQEHKENEGDPHIRSARRRLHRELSERNAKKSAAQASALVVNPQHIACAIRYDESEEFSVPVLTAKGVDDLALEMRRAAEAAGVPIVRNEKLAQSLLANTEEGHNVPEVHYEIIADILIWAVQVREELENIAAGGTFAAAQNRRDAPGEDMTAYPLGHPGAPEKIR